MNTSEFVDAVYLLATGKLPTFGAESPKYQKIVAIANLKISTWERERDADWNSLYQRAMNIGTVTASDSFPLTDAIRLVSDTRGDDVTIVRLDGKKSTYQLVQHDELSLFGDGNYCAKIGRNLVFNRTFTASDPEFGGSIKVPGYIYATKLVDDTTDVPVDDPNWLVTVTAAEYVRNDIVKQNQYGNLIQEANDLMENMKADNDAQTSEVVSEWGVMGANWN